MAYFDDKIYGTMLLTNGDKANANGKKAKPVTLTVQC